MGFAFQLVPLQKSSSIKYIKEFETISNSTWTQVWFLIVSHQIDWLLNHCGTLMLLNSVRDSRSRGKTEGAFGSIVSPHLWGCVFVFFPLASTSKVDLLFEGIVSFPTFYRIMWNILIAWIRFVQKRCDNWGINPARTLCVWLITKCEYIRRPPAWIRPIV